MKHRARAEIGKSLVAVLVLLGGRAVAQADNEPRRATTDHLVVVWADGTTEADIAAAKAEGEKFYEKIAGILGHGPESKVHLFLGGAAQRPDGSWEYPRVDPFGRILLWKYGRESETYFSALAHEMVHVFRFARHAKADWFFEEGFAELVALEVDDSLEGFPWYGFSPVVVAGQWVAAEQDIPLSTLREKHRELNQPCKFQSYSLRAAFFRWLRNRYGLEAVLGMAAQERAGELADYPRFFKKGFLELEQQWRAALLEEYRATPGVEELVRRYREDPAVRHAQVCRRGDSF